MPVYQYECEKCNKVYDEYWEMNKDPKQIDCQNIECKGIARRIIAGGQAFIFKGKGTHNEGFDSPYTKDKRKFSERTQKEQIDSIFKNRE